MATKKKDNFGEDDVTFKESHATAFAASEELFDVTFRENRSFEIVVSRVFMRFEGSTKNPVNVYQGGVPADIINHPDFQANRKYFNIVKQGV